MSDRDRSVSPDEVPLCILISYFVKPPIRDEITREIFDPLLTSKHIAVFLLQELTHVDRATYTDLSTLLLRLREQVVPSGEQLIRDLVHTLEALQSPNEIGKLFADLGSCLLTAQPGEEPPPNGPIMGVGSSSVLGLFLRRCRVNFACMPYEAVGQLWQEVRERLAAALDPLPGSQPEPTLRSPPALQAFLQSTQRIIDREGAILPAPAVEAQLADLQGHEAAAPGVVLARFRAALQQGGHPAAIDQLHRYFDLTLHRALPNPFSLDATKERANNALLLLSSTEADLGNSAGALLALNEALQTAQQQRDDATLGQALAELCRVMPSAGVLPSLLHEPGSQRRSLLLYQMLHKCLEQGTQLSLPHLTAFARTALARYHLERQMDTSSTGGLPPATDSPAPSSSTPSIQLVTQQLREVCHLQTAASLAAASATSTPAGPPRGAGGAPLLPARGIGTELYAAPGPPVFSPSLATPAAQAAVAAAVNQHAGEAHLVAAAAWATHGNPSLAHTHALAALFLHGPEAPAPQRALAFAQLADETLKKQGLRASQEVLDAATVPRHVHPALMMAHLQWQATAHLHLGNVHLVEAAADAMRGLGGPGTHGDPLLRLQAARCRVEALEAAGNAEGALKAATSLFTNCCQTGMQVEAVRTLLLLARIHRGVGDCCGALPHLLSCLLHAQHLDLALLLAEAAVQLADLLLGLVPSERELLLDLVEEQLPLLLAHGSCKLQAETLWLLADTFMQGCQSAEEVASSWERWLKPLLEQALEGFTSAELWGRVEEVVMALAAGYEAVGDATARDAMAHQVVSGVVAQKLQGLALV